jgi:hypothetical protein
MWTVATRLLHRVEQDSRPLVGRLSLPAVTTAEHQWRSEARLGARWQFGEHDRPHFVTKDRRRWLVLDEEGRWEAWLGHHPVGRFATLRQAERALRRARAG